jgi:hypothetical protein
MPDNRDFNRTILHQMFGFGLSLDGPHPVLAVSNHLEEHTVLHRIGATTQFRLSCGQFEKGEELALVYMLICRQKRSQSTD